METLRSRKHEKDQNHTTTITITTTATTTTHHHHLLHLLPLLLFFLLPTSFTPLSSFAAAEETPPPPPPDLSTKPPLVNGSEVTTPGGGGGGGEQIVNETKYENFSDVTKFVAGINGWDFMGSWAKYDLSKLSETQRPVPLVTDGDDQGVFICQTSAIPSTLEKEFPALHNASFALTYYGNGPLLMTGEVLGAGDEVETLFNQTTAGEDGTRHAAGTWGTDNFTLPLLAATGSFKLRVSVQHSEQGVWAAAEMRVEGIAGPPLPPVTTPVPPSGNITTNGSNSNETTTTTTTPAPPQGNITTAAPPNTTTSSTSTTTEATDDVSDLQGIAQAIWDAFYVFLALFCACLVALIALIVHGRCKDDEPPPAVATYNPRTASYRMDKVYDNPSYDNNSV